MRDFVPQFRSRQLVFQNIQHLKNIQEDYPNHQAFQQRGNAHYVQHQRVRF